MVDSTWGLSATAGYFPPLEVHFNEPPSWGSCLPQFQTLIILINSYSPRWPSCHPRTKVFILFFYFCLLSLTLIDQDEML